LLKDGADIPLRPKTFAVLCCLVEHHGVLVTRQQLLDAVWPNAIISDETITQSLAEIRKALDDGSREMIRTVPRRGYLFDLPAGKLGQIEGPRGPAPSDPPVGPAVPTGTRPGGMLIRGILVVLIVVVAFLAIDRWALAPRGDPFAPGSDAPAGATETPEWDNQSVAVLPFVNRSARQEDRYFTDGIHDELLARLSRNAALRVISRTSVMRYADTQKPIPEIARELRVGTIIEGGVQRSGDQVRINVQVIDANTDEHLWAEIYDRELTAESLFAIQSEVSNAISGLLAATLSADERRQRDPVPTRSLPALESYFLGNQAMNRRTTASLADAVGHFKRAIELDPDYAGAYVALANTYDLQVFHSAVPYQRQKALARPLVEKALEIDDQLGEAYIALTWWADDPQSEEALYKKGIDLAPGYVPGRVWYGDWLISQGRFAEAYEQMVLAARLDPLSSPVRLGLGEALDHLGRFEEARAQYESIIRMDPEFARVYHRLGNLEWQVLGRADQSVLRNRQATDIDPDSPRAPANLAQLWLELGDPVEAHRWAERVRANAESEGWRSWMSWYETFYRDGPAAAVGFAAALLAAVPDHASALWALGLNDVDSGQPDRCVERYRNPSPELVDEEPPAIDDTNVEAMVGLAYCLQAAGDRLQADRLFDRALAYVETTPRLGLAGQGITDARIFAMRGQTDLALAALREAFDAGWRLHWRMHLQLSPEFAGLHSEPGFQALVAELEADMAEQIRRIRELEARGELPSAPE
jgi:TolB-like protein/DNA-binding winged helix-turn-helix (wHTH) protein/Flp pilus assembly protein TadD